MHNVGLGLLSSRFGQLLIQISKLDVVDGKQQEFLDSLDTCSLRPHSLQNPVQVRHRLGRMVLSGNIWLDGQSANMKCVVLGDADISESEDCFPYCD